MELNMQQFATPFRPCLSYCNRKCLGINPCVVGSILLVKIMKGTKRGYFHSSEKGVPKRLNTNSGQKETNI